MGPIFALGAVYSFCQPAQPLPLPPIAHAGGEIESLTDTNSLEAIDGSVRAGYRFIEIDFEWTSDGHRVLLHDWKSVFKRLFGEDEGKRTLASFRSAIMAKGPTQLTAVELMKWLERNPNISVVTDVKDRNADALRFLREAYPSSAARPIPQIHDFPDYEPVAALGFERIILTLYRTPARDAQVIELARAHSRFAVTVPT